MKKLLALALVVFGLAACQTEPEGINVDANGEAAVTLNVALPDDATRAAGADSAKGAIGNVDMSKYDIRYILEIYDENGVLAKDRMVETSDETTAAFSFRLIPGRPYNFVVWADFVLNGTKGDLHYNTNLGNGGLRKVEVNKSQWDVIDESRDAYTDVVTVHNFSGSANIEPIILKRPFAKLRVVTNDIKEMISIRPAEVKVEYINTKFRDTFDAFTEEATGEYVVGALTATLLDSQKNPVDVYSGENPNETGVQTLFADYFFGAADDRVMFTMDVKDNSGRDLPQVTFNTNIPVKRNMLTTVYGPVLTDANNITVTIDPAFENGTNWNPGDDKYDVEVFSGIYTKTITLKSGRYFFQDVTVNTTEGPAIKIAEGAEVTIDVQGNLKLVGTTDGIAVPNDSKLTINGISNTRAEGDKYGNLNVVAKGGYGIGGIGADVTIKNTTIDYICGWPVQPLFVNDTSYGKDEPEGYSAIGGAKIVIDNVEIKKAEGGSKAAAIGNRYWQSTDITIKNSILGDIFGGNASAAIGGSRYSSNDTKHNININIEGTTITNAVGGQFAAGIGAGYDTHCSANDSNAVNNIVITNSNITVKGGKYGAGIGTGYHSAALTGSIDAASKINATAGESREKYTLAQNIGYGVVDATREFKDAQVTFTVAGVVIPSPVAYDNIAVVTTIEALQKAIDEAKSGDNLIRFGADLVGNAYIAQKEGIDLIIDGCGYKFNGGFIVDGKNRSTGTDKVLFTDINFYTETTGALTFISCPSVYNGEKERYSHNVTIDGCTFSAPTLLEDVGAINAQKTYHLAVKNCSATNLHSLLQVQSCDNDVTIENVVVNGCKSGISVGNTKDTHITNAQIVAQKYGIRLDGAGERKVTVVVDGNSSITAYAPVVARKVTAGCNVEIDLSNNTTLTRTGEGLYDVVVAGNKDYEDGNVTPTEPTGEWNVLNAGTAKLFPEKMVAKVGDVEYGSIDEAIANWTNGKTLYLLDNITLTDVVTIKSTEHHILNLGTYTLTAAEGKNAFEITACGTGASERYAITIDADATNPGSINAGKKSIVYYDYSKGTATGDDRPIIKINGGVFYGSTASWGTAGIYFKGGSAARQAATLNISGGEFHCSINGQSKSKLIISGGLFHYSVGSQGDSTANRLISGGTFKTLGFMTADSKNTKFWFGTSMANSNVGLYINDDNYLVVGGPVITEFGDKFKAKATNPTKWSDYLQYSSAATHGLYYTNAELAIKKHGEAYVELP